ncbi:hypothetical protein A6A04_08960 [Paramagnetospirillum marisnigri]|uniref:Uncharacterized protein n=1 Tax=Paramagnetospirillum marisnigri TaxID=1285242 RepID=A0A178M5H9_9PROT|nr:hypothetical protein [Paramagnetospirillum marisnigri]OAN44001.1 hypothetical protein A6A04_08960 [Paramagnetospirillum marisnigri]
MGMIIPNLRPDLDALQVDVAVASLRDVLKDGWSVLALSTGMADAFTDQTGIAALGGGAYDATAKTVRNQSVSSGTAATSWSANSTFGAWVGRTVVDMSFTVTNGATVTKIGVYSTVAASIPVKLMQRTGAGAFTVVASATLAHGGTGWEDATLSSAYAVPGSGTFCLAAYASSGYSMVNGAPGNAAWMSGDASGAVSMTEVGSGTAQAPILRYTYQTVGAAAAVTVVSAAFALGFQPSQARIVCPVELGGGAIGTDCMLDLSRDGTTWAAVTLADLGKFNATTRIVGGLVNLSAQPAGSSIYWRWRTSAAYTLSNHGVWIQAK